MATRRSPGLRRAKAARWLEVAGLAVIAYLPFLLSSPGRVSADSKQYLYLDPGQFLGRAVNLWDAQAAAGGVSHQHIGYLWPMGPWFWVGEALGLPDWITQRLWLGTVTLAAALGTRWLLREIGLSRLGVLVGTLVYMLAPYQLAFTARSSVLLLPWAGLPWLVGLSHRAVSRGGWRDPAWIALVVLTIGSVNASSLILVAVGPAVWLLLGISDRAAARRVAGVVARSGLLTLGVSLWWVAALRLEAAYGLPVLQVTEKLEDVARTSTPLDVLRGLGNWFFYGRDRLGPSIDQSADYLSDRITLLATFGLAGLGLAAGILVRWTYRARFAAMVVIGTVVSVGAWPLDDPSPFAKVVAELSDTSAGLALRNTARAAPVIVLGVAGLLGAATTAWPTRRFRVPAAAIVAVLAFGSLAPVARTGFLSEHLDRQDPIPDHWDDAATHLDRGSSTRVLEIPGSNFATYRWGNTVDPILPGLMDRRGQVAREVLPHGSPSSALLLDALDRRIQEGTFEPQSLAPVARLFGVGDVVVRSDLEYERFRTPVPRDLWATLTGAELPGLGAPEAFGDEVPNVPSPAVPTLGPIELRSSRDPDPPPVATFPVVDPVPIVRTAPAARPVVIAGDGDGIIDAAAAGLIDGTALVQQATSLDDAALDGALDQDADLILTDTYRRRIQTWFYAIRDTRGPTEQAGETLAEPTGYDYRVDPTPDVGDLQRTVVEQAGGRIRATGGGGASRPEDRAASAVDGDLTTAWRVGGADPTGPRLVLEAPEPVRVDHITLVQPQEGPQDRVVTSVRLRLDDGSPVDVDLGPESLQPEGQRISFAERDVRTLDIEITGASTPPFDPALANAVGFAEVDLAGIRVLEEVRVPTSLLERASDGSQHRLDIVLTRLRYDPGERGRHDQERILRRTVTLPARRVFGLAGTLRVSADVGEEELAELIGGDARAVGSSRLEGDLRSRGASALDGDLSTAWRPQMGMQQGSALHLRLPTERALSGLTARFALDDHHSMPTRVTLIAAGRPVGSVDVPVGADAEGLVSVALPAPDGPVSDLELRIDAVERRTPTPGDLNEASTLPIALVELTGEGVPVLAAPETVALPCLPLLQVDGVEVPVRASGSVADLRRGLDLEACGGPLDLAAGRHQITSVRLDHRFDVDRLVLSSGADGAPATVEPRGTPRDEAGATVRVDKDDRGASYDLTVSSDGEPFWLVLGQSDNRGWELDVDGATVGPRQIVDGYANGWLVDPEGPGSLSASLRWAPQRLVWIALAISALTVLGCVLLLMRRRPSSTRTAGGQPRLTWPAAGRRPLSPGVPLLATMVGLVTLLVATPVAAAVAVGAVLVGAAVPRATLVWAALAMVLVLVADDLDQPKLAWVALALLGADLAVQHWVERAELSSRRRRPGRSDRST